MATATKKRVKKQVIEVENIIEEKTSGTLTQIQEVGRKSVLATLGIGRMIYDGAMNSVDRSKRLFDEAVERGEGVEQQAMENAKEMTGQVEEQASKMQENIVRNFRRSENGLDSRIEAVLERLDLPSRSSIAKLNAEIQALDKKVNALVATQAEVTVEQPMPDYVSLTAKEIVSKLNTLTIEELVAVKQYEMAQEDRVTVLREVDRRLKAMPIARYDALTVDEIEPLLATLDVDQLETVAEYETAHENRVTLLRAIESEVEARKTAVA